MRALQLLRAYFEQVFIALDQLARQPHSMG